MTKKTLRTETAKSKVDMTPMLDIVFILLIFFIVTTSFIKEQGLLVKRPEMNKAASDTSPAMVLKISDTGLVFFNGSAVDIERVPARIENFIAKNDSNSAIIIPDHNTRHEAVVAVIDQVKAFSNITVSIGK